MVTGALYSKGAGDFRPVKTPCWTGYQTTDSGAVDLAEDLAGFAKKVKRMIHRISLNNDPDNLSMRHYSLSSKCTLTNISRSPAPQKLPRTGAMS
jgi:hypothetical protein